MNIKRAFSTFATVLLMAAAARAEVIPGRWEKVEALAPGTAVIVWLRGGERMEGTFNGIDLIEVFLIESDGAERRLPRIAVQRIESASVVRDRLRNGTLYGAVAGAAAGIISMIAYGNAVTEGPVHWSGEDGPAYLAGSALVGAGIGAALGAIVDASIKRHEVYYRARKE